MQVCINTFGIAILTIDESDGKRNVKKKMISVTEFIFATEKQRKMNFFLIIRTLSRRTCSYGDNETDFSFLLINLLLLRRLNLLKSFRILYTQTAINRSMCVCHLLSCRFQCQFHYYYYTISLYKNHSLIKEHFT